MATNAALGASGLSFALGVMNSRQMNFLTEEVDNMKKSMTPSHSEHPTNPDLDNELSDIASRSDFNKKSIEDVVSRIQELEDSVGGVDSLSDETADTASELKDLKSEFDTLDAKFQDTMFDVETVVGLEPSIQDLLTNWKSFNVVASVTDADVFTSTLSNMGMIFNHGEASAIRFNGLNSSSWAMYGSSASGKGPDGKSAPVHGDVTGNAARVRIGNSATDGFIVETSDRKALFSVGSNGKTMSGSVVSGVIDSSSGMGAVSHASNFNNKIFAIAQASNGETFVNAREDTKLNFSVNGVTKGYFEGPPSKTLTLKNMPDADDTHFNHNGNNYILCGANASTVFRAGKDRHNRLTVNKDGTYVSGLLSVDNVSVNDVVKDTPGQITSLSEKISDLTGIVEALSTRVGTIESKYLDRTVDHTIRNTSKNKYLNANGDVGTHRTDAGARYRIDHR